MNAHKLLWGLVALFAVETVAGVFYQNLASTVLQLATMIAFMLLHGALRYRVEGIVVFAVTPPASRSGPITTPTRLD